MEYIASKKFRELGYECDRSCDGILYSKYEGDVLIQIHFEKHPISFSKSKSVAVFGPSKPADITVEEMEAIIMQIKEYQEELNERHSESLYEYLLKNSIPTDKKFQEAEAKEIRRLSISPKNNFLDYYENEQSESPKTAKEMAEELGYKYENLFENIVLISNNTFSLRIDNDKHKIVINETDEDALCEISENLLLVIQKQIEEFGGWTNEH